MQAIISFNVSIVVETTDEKAINSREIREELDAAISHQWKQSGLIGECDTSTVQDFTVAHTGTRRV